MQAIATIYHGPTDRRGARISATSASGERVYHYVNQSLADFENHAAAAYDYDVLELGPDGGEVE